MGLRLIYGPSASGKTDRITKEIADMIHKDPERSVIYIAPEQMTLQVEQMLMDNLHTDSLIGPSVFGFKRLAYRVFEEVGMPEVTWLDDVGKSMILERIAREHQSELVYFGKSTSQRGFIERLKLMVTEIIQYRLDEETLRKMAEEHEEHTILREKLNDIALLWHYFNEYLEQQGSGGRILASEMLLDEFAPVISRSEWIKGSRIYIDGYTGFTPQQYRIIEELIRHAEQVSVVLTMTKEAFQEADNVPDWRNLPVRLYFTAQKTASKLSTISRELSCKREIEYCEVKEETRPKELRHALDHLFGNGSRMWEGPSEHVFTYTARSMQEEIAQVMHRVLQLVRDEGYQFHEIALVCADLPNYSHALSRAAALYGFPVFIDDKVDVKLNPMIQWIESVCQMAATGFSSNSFLTYMKTGLSGQNREMVDLVENEALKNNWIGKERIVSGLEAMAPELAKQIADFAENTSGEREAAAFSKALWEMAEQQKVEETITGWAQALRDEGELLYAIQYERILGEIRKVTDQLDHIMAGIQLHFDEYAEMLKMGISQCRMGQLPAKLDEMNIGDLQRSKVEGMRAIFFLGIQSGSFPMIHKGGSLLTDSERGKLKNIPEIAQGERESLMEQYYLAMMTLGKASEKVYFFSHKVNDKGEETGPSSLWRRLEKTFHMERCTLQEDHDITLPLPLLYEDGRREIAEYMADTEENEYVFRNVQMIQSGEEHQETEGSITPALARKLMDPTRRLLSVTQLERYGSCPYAYYLQYGLGLKEREVPKVGALEDGTVLHELLKDAGDYLQAILSDTEAMKIAQELAEKKQEEYKVYQTSGRFRYYWDKLQRSAAWSLQHLSRQAALSDFKHAAFEWEFSDKAGCGEPVTVQLQNGQEIRLQGKIDRVDLWSEEEQRYVQIIDYKSGNKKIENEKLAAGLQLQLPVYMEAAEKNFHAKPAGFFYFHVTPKDVDAAKDDELWDKLMQNNRLAGIYVADPELAQHMDLSMGTGSGPGLVIPGGITKAGKMNMQSKSSYATAEQMEKLKGFVHGKIASMAEEILDGRVCRYPVDDGQKLHCIYCDYKNACPYDGSMPGARKRVLGSLKIDALWNMVENGE